MKGMKIKFWLVEIVLTGLGLLLARVIPRLLVQPVLELVSYIIGVILALTGLVIIIFGMNRGTSGSPKKTDKEAI